MRPLLPLALAFATVSPAVAQKGGKPASARKPAAA
ncbi:MAG: hypothetical protein K0Q72_3091, partial [Armatimonadetes bacterium]|nr:hypothetical protein [Armatimonadota bacterium]